MALALVLLVGSGLMLRSYQALRDVDPGFETDNVHLVRRLDERAVGQRVSANGSDDEGIEFLRQDGAACGKAVRRRADRRADDESVAADVPQGSTVNFEFEIKHVEGRQGVHHDLAQAEKDA